MTFFATVVMVAFTGIAYKDICIAAFVPALFYLVSAGCYTIFQAGGMKVTTTTVEVDKRELMLRAPLFATPLLVIIVLLLMDYSPMIASFWACIALIIMSLIRPKARPSLSGYLEGFRSGVPYLITRVSLEEDIHEMRQGYKHEHHLTKKIPDYLRMFYNDTAVYGGTAALMCAYAFCGADHMLFTTDMPFDSQTGYRLVREAIRSIEEMDITDAEKRKIFGDNARKLLRLPI